MLTLKPFCNRSRFRPARTPLVALAAFAAASFPLRAAETPLAIAAVGPLTGSAAARGKDLDQAVRMAVEEINGAGGVNGRRIELSIYDDGDQPARAAELAAKIASTSALAVLGQVASSAAFAAGQVYREKQIPAITGAASESRVTKGNDWFFRTFPDSAGQGRFLADYAHYNFGARRLVVIREKGTSGEEFAAALRDRAKSQGIRIDADLEFLPAQANDAAFMAALAQKVAKAPKGEIIVLGSQYAETPFLLRALRDKLGPFTSLGYSSLATGALNGFFTRAENERHLPVGYYTDRFTVAAPQLGDIAEYAQTLFAAKYKARYGAEPNPEAVRWYEGARLIFQAMAAKGVTGEDRAAGRRAIRDWLASLNSPSTAAAGTGGPVYFDQDHNVQRGIAIGVFYQGRLVSAPWQFAPVSDPTQVPGWDRLVSSGNVIDGGGSKLVKIPVIYAGIDLNSLDNIDVRANSFAADFFLWFRYQDDLKPDMHEVEFPTAVSGAALGKDVWNRSQDGFTTVAFHVKGVFHADYEFSRFPFDHQTLHIPVQFHNRTSYDLILAYGGASSIAATAPGATIAGNGKTASGVPALGSKLWRLDEMLFYRDVIAQESSFGDGEAARNNTVQFNRINASIGIERDVLGFAVKNFLPLLCILVAILVGYAIAPDVINPRVSIGVTALLTTSVLYQKLAGDLPTVTYIIAMDYVFFAFFGFCVAFLGITVVSYETHKAKRAKPTRLLNQAGAGMTLAGLGATLLFVSLQYWRQ
jgi:ABC-type branched-subunit amino acid transport system substrate-binding protein